MRRARVDGNHSDVVKALRQIGASVQDLSGVGQGVPDLLVGFHGVTMLLEVKDGALPPSARKLTADQRVWHAKWAGHVAVVTTPEEAQMAVIEGARL